MMPEAAFWPTTAEGWTAIAANVFTVVGAITLTAAVHFNLSAAIRWQRLSVRMQQLSALSSDADIPMSEVTRNLLNTVLHWSQSKAFSQGINDSAKVTSEYREYVARLVALFDLVLMDRSEQANPLTRAKIAEQLAKHSLVIDGLEMRWFQVLPMSRDMKQLLRSMRGPTI